MVSFAKSVNHGLSCTLMGKICDTGILIYIFEEGMKYLGGIY